MGGGGGGLIEPLPRIATFKKRSLIRFKNNCFKFRYNPTLTLFRMALFGAAHGWSKKHPPP